jgi:broad specificity polyphosphatase/5'/3'-nucleotidase SurE
MGLGYSAGGFLKRKKGGSRRKYTKKIAFVFKIVFNTVSNASMLHLLVTANVPSSHILSTPKMEATRSSETSVVTRPIQRHNPEDGTLKMNWLQFS